MAAFSIHPSPPRDPANRLTVLLGNNPADLEAWHTNARGLLEAQGVGTLVARTGREAMGLIEESALGKRPRIHVAVLDQRLPVMGGLQILRRLQQDLEELEDLGSEGSFTASASVSEAGQRIPPTILLADPSARGLASSLMHEALTAQVFSVLPKPIELNLLLDTLARALRRYYQNRWPEAERMKEEG